jgi:hypothetical protein
MGIGNGGSAVMQESGWGSNAMRESKNGDKRSVRGVMRVVVSLTTGGVNMSNQLSI